VRLQNALKLVHLVQVKLIASHLESQIYGVQTYDMHVGDAYTLGRVAHTYLAQVELNGSIVDRVSTSFCFVGPEMDDKNAVVPFEYLV
jgi:hypothetical protein